MLHRLIRRAQFSTVKAQTQTLLSERITADSISSHVKKAEYAVRGPIVTKSMEINDQLLTGKKKFPFTKTIQCNIGNPHSLEQSPLTYMRQVLSLTVNPSLMDQAKSLYPPEAMSRATKYLERIPGMGAYSESQGIAAVREDICKFLEQRDGYTADASNIFVTNGASDGVRLCFQTVIRSGPGFKDGILTPIPQYPLYSALTALLNGHLVPYYLDESKGWSCSTESLTESLAAASKDKITTRGLVVINPGNPTGKSVTIIFAEVISNQTVSMKYLYVQAKYWT
jgi:alanine transaminase